MKQKFAALIVFFALSNLGTAQQQQKTYIGYKHKGVVFGATLPNGVKDSGGGLLSDDSYGVTRFTKNGKYMLWLEKITSRNRNGVPNWQVKDVLTFGKLKQNQAFIFSYSGNCTQNNRENFDLIVLAELAAKSKTYKIINAWRANLKREKFEKASIKGIKCAYVKS